MQNRYAGDIGDFGKFQLLRYLFLEQSYTMAQIWYLYPDESHNSDGLHINYFEKVKDVDVPLEMALKEISLNNRNVKALEGANLLNEMKYFSKFIVNNQKSKGYRSLWFKEALSFSSGADIIAVDPDNGIATKCIKKDKKFHTIEMLESSVFKSKSGKYIFLDEIDALTKQCPCLVVYHHLNRTTTHDNQVCILLKKLQKKYGLVLAIKHKPYSPRVYFFVCQDEELFQYLQKKLVKFKSLYSNHWQVFV